MTIASEKSRQTTKIYNRRDFANSSRSDRDSVSARINQHVGARLRAARALAGISQEKAGELIDVSFQQIQKYEKGVNRITVGALAVFADAFNVPVTWFLEGAPGVDGVSARPRVDVAAALLSKLHGRDLATDFLLIKRSGGSRCRGAGRSLARCQGQRVVIAVFARFDDGHVAVGRRQQHQFSTHAWRASGVLGNGKAWQMSGYSTSAARAEARMVENTRHLAKSAIAFRQVVTINRHRAQVAA